MNYNLLVVKLTRTCMVHITNKVTHLKQKQKTIINNDGYWLILWMVMMTMIKMMTL